MRLSHLRHFAVASSAVAWICFSSCERHHADELPPEPEMAKSSVHEHGVQPKQDAETKAHGPTATPAQFFPSPSPL